MFKMVHAMSEVNYHQKIKSDPSFQEILRVSAKVKFFFSLLSPGKETACILEQKKQVGKWSKRISSFYIANFLDCFWSGINLTTDWCKIKCYTLSIWTNFVHFVFKLAGLSASYYCGESWSFKLTRSCCVTAKIWM